LVVRGDVLIGFGREVVDLSRVHVGDKLWKTSDPELDKELRQSYAGEKPHFQRLIRIEVHGSASQALTVIARDESGNTARAESAIKLVNADTQPLTDDKLREQFGRLGGTPFRLGEVINRLQPGLMLPVSELNRLRRELVQDLEAQRKKPRRWRLVQEADSAPIRREINRPSCNSPRLIVLVRNLAQVEAALGCGMETIYCEFEDPKKYREAVQMTRASRPCAGAGRPEIFTAPPRIYKEGEEWTLNLTRASEPDGFLVRNYDHLHYFAGSRLIGDFSLNVANRLTAEYFLEKFGLERVTASYDLNAGQLEALLKATAASWFEITIHQHMPMFHMEHCVFCAFLTSGTDYTNCGRPCDHHDLRLRDRVGAEHPVKADAGCRNTVFNSRAQTGAEFVARLIELGARHFRIEFLNDSPEQVAKVIEMYRRLLRGEINGGQLWRELKLVNQLGVTRGQMGG
jgi:putative protease